MSFNSKSFADFLGWREPGDHLQSAHFTAQVVEGLPLTPGLLHYTDPS